MQILSEKIYARKKLFQSHEALQEQDWPDSEGQKGKLNSKFTHSPLFHLPAVLGMTFKWLVLLTQQS
jgi:hypothetical protein